MNWGARGPADDLAARVVRRHRNRLPSRAMNRPADGVRAPIPIPVAELDRKLKWGFIPIVVFAAWMVLLAVMAALSLLRTPAPTTGLPADADVVAARSLVAGRFPPTPGPFLFRATLLGDPAPAGTLALETLQRAARAESLLERAARRHPLDGRVPAALASLDLARGTYARAAHRYQRALDLAPHYPEARLGLGAALALAAESQANPLERRGERLKAIAQFAAVEPGQAGDREALYDRAWLEVEVGRRDEAHAAALRYFAADSTSAAAHALTVQLASGGR